MTSSAISTVAVPSVFCRPSLCTADHNGCAVVSDDTVLSDKQWWALFSWQIGYPWARDAILYHLLCLCLTKMFTLSYGFMNWSLYMVLVFVDVFVWNRKGSLAFFQGNQIALTKTVFYYSSLIPRSVCTLNSLCWVQHIIDVFRLGKSVCA